MCNTLPINAFRGEMQIYVIGSLNMVAQLFGAVILVE